MKFLTAVLMAISALAVADTVYRTENGAPVSNYRSSMTIGSRGSTLLEDTVLIEALQIQNRERIPERTVHARGTVAKGTFKLTKDMSKFTTANFLTGVGKTTDVACRFSTVIHPRGSPEFLRDPRGFALKFYTEEGNYDIVGLNFPVFFIRDGIRFPHMVRALKPNPVSGLQDWWRIWDYFSHFPESLHMFTFLLDDDGIPLTYRNMDGFGIHAFKWINAQNQTKYIRYHWKTAQGLKSFKSDAEAEENHFSFHTYDLYKAILDGRYPKWTMFVQMMDPEIVKTLDFDPLDTTKLWPEEQFPWMEFGELKFTENAHQFFENEMIAFSPGRFVPGILPSEDKMLQARIFAYTDTQRHRLGVNNQMLPINRPKCVAFDPHVDGGMNFQDPSVGTSAQVNYFPSHYGGVVEGTGIPEDHKILKGRRTRVNILADDFVQPRERFQSWDAERQDRFAGRVAEMLMEEGVAEEIQKIWLGYWNQVDPNLCEMIKGHMADS